MAEEPECQLRRRRSSGNPNLPLNLEVGFQITEGEGTSQGTPSPGNFKLINAKDRSPSAALLEFRKKQQSFDVQEIQIEECEEEEILVDSDDEGEEASVADRPFTPIPIQDFSVSTVYTEGPQKMDFLKVSAIETDCVTDVSDADDDDEE